MGSGVALSSGAPNETFVHWLYWDNVGGLFIAGIVLLVTPFVFGGIAALIGEVVSRRRVLAGEESSASCCSGSARRFSW